MKEIGRIKWFGGYSRGKGKLNDFGYILRKNKPDLYFNRAHIRCKINELTNNKLVSFEIGMNFKNNMEQGFKVKVVKSQDKDLIFNEEVFKDLTIEEQMLFLDDYEENDVLKLWQYMSFKLKTLLIFKVAAGKFKTSILENLLEENKFIRALIILAWIKDNINEKSAIYEKAEVLLSIYNKEISSSQDKIEELKFAFPCEKGYKVDINRNWSKWTVLEFLQSVNGDNIAEDIENGNKELIELVRCINGYIKISNR